MIAGARRAPFGIGPPPSGLDLGGTPEGDEWGVTLDPEECKKDIKGDG